MRWYLGLIPAAFMFDWALLSFIAMSAYVLAEALSYPQWIRFIPTHIVPPLYFLGCYALYQRGHPMLAVHLLEIFCMLCVAATVCFTPLFLSWGIPLSFYGAVIIATGSGVLAFVGYRSTMRVFIPTFLERPAQK